MTATHSRAVMAVTRLKHRQNIRNGSDLHRILEVEEEEGTRTGGGCREVSPDSGTVDIDITGRINCAIPSCKLRFLARKTGQARVLFCLRRFASDKGGRRDGSFAHLLVPSIIPFPSVKLNCGTHFQEGVTFLVALLFCVCVCVL